MDNRARFAALSFLQLVALGASTGACATTDSIEAKSTAASTGTTTMDDDGLASTDSGSGSCEPDSADAQGCACTPDEPPRPCSTGDAACPGGTQTCEITDGEVQTGAWGACTCACVAGSQTFSTPGTFELVVPPYAELIVEVWGGGGAGEAWSETDASTPGGDSSFDQSVVGEGGEAGNASVAGGEGGVGEGGTTNLTGAHGGNACKTVLQVCGGGLGGDGANGGSGGVHIGLDGCSGGDGGPGSAPGGGGAGTWTCQGPWWMGQGWGMGGGGGGGGGYAAKTYAKGELTVGAKVTVVVGAGGIGAKGAVTSGFPAEGRNPGYYTGGDGGDGQVKVSWTCDAGSQ